MTMLLALHTCRERVLHNSETLAVPDKGRELCRQPDSTICTEHLPWIQRTYAGNKTSTYMCSINLQQAKLGKPAATTAHTHYAMQCIPSWTVPLAALEP